MDRRTAVVFFFLFFFWENGTTMVAKLSTADARCRSFDGTIYYFEDGCRKSGYDSLLVPQFGSSCPFVGSVPSLLAQDVRSLSTSYGHVGVDDMGSSVHIFVVGLKQSYRFEVLDEEPPERKYTELKRQA